MKKSKYIMLLILLSASVLFCNNTRGANTKQTTTMVNYKLLFKIELRHSYFEESKLRDVVVKPSEDSALLLQEFDMPIVLQENVLNVYLPQTTNALDLIALGITLQFDMVSQDPYFSNYTALPLKEKGIVLFTNDTASSHPALLSTAHQTRANPTQIVGRIAIGLANLPYADNQEPFTYIAQFTARAVAVKYRVMAPPSKTQLKIKGDDAALFSGPYPLVLVDGTNVQVFDSGTNLFPLSEVSLMNNRIQFMIDFTTKETSKLPPPIATTLTIEDDKLVSIIYIQL